MTAPSWAELGASSAGSPSAEAYDADYDANALQPISLQQFYSQ